MKKHSYKGGFGYIEAALVVIIVVIIAFVGWYVLHAKHSVDTTLSQTQKSSASAAAVKQAPSSLALVQAKLPEGWKLARKSSGVLSVTNPTTQCSSQINYDTTTSSETSTQGQQAVSAIKSEGNTVKTLPQSQLSILTESGTQSVKTLSVKVSTPSGDASYREYATATTDGGNAAVQLSCANAADLSSARTALQAIKVNQ